MPPANYTPPVPVSVAYYFTRVCNFKCKFCFHTAKNSTLLDIEEAKRGLRMLADAGMKKITFAGGEPFTQPRYLGDLVTFCKRELRLESVGIITNGSKVSESWLKAFGSNLDQLGVVNKLNWEEDMNSGVEVMDPYRWKVFQCLILEGENSGSETSINDARELVVTDEQFAAFIKRHDGQKNMFAESSELMKDSYLLLDEEMRFLDCSGGGKVPGRSLLQVGVDQALRDGGFDQEAFDQRGGVYDWTKPAVAEDNYSW
ncbi:radical S-adenosyl methionine domain-containing protein 2, partial [Phenoliferia sp. Uapishka_3]